MAAAGGGTSAGHLGPGHQRDVEAVLRHAQQYGQALGGTANPAQAEDALQLVTVRRAGRGKCLGTVLLGTASGESAEAHVVVCK
eukprot:scaffold113378_cov23-Tisochrysis_lutea.AAC.1